MKYPKYKIVEWDPVNDLYFIKKKVFWFIYTTVSVGSLDKLQEWLKSHNINES